MNVFRIYCDGICIEDFTPQEAKNIGRILLEISALALGDQGQEHEERDRRIYTYDGDNLTLRVEEFWDGNKRHDVTVYKVDCCIGDKNITVFVAEQYPDAERRPEYYIRTYREISTWPEHLHGLAADNAEVKEFNQNFSQLSLAELAFK